MANQAPGTTSPSMDEDGKRSTTISGPDPTSPDSRPALCEAPPVAMATMSPSLSILQPSHSSDRMDASGPPTPQIPIHLTATPETAAQSYSPTVEHGPFAGTSNPSRMQILHPCTASPLAKARPLNMDPRGKSPALWVVIPWAELPSSLGFGIREVIHHALQANVSLDDAPAYRDLNRSETVVFSLVFQQDTALAMGGLQVSCQLADIPRDTSDAPRYHVIIRYHRPIEAFRALGRILTSVHHTTDPEEFAHQLGFEEFAQFESLGVMIDCSRNGVLLVPRVFEIIRYCALLGINMIQLYTEDTYQIPDEPFFGYLRGAYTAHELRAIDDYADAVGIEIVPCIQTLGHLGQILQWPRFAHVRDTSEVLLSKCDETYELIKKMIRTVAEPLRSRRIHIGMDEAYGVGEGRFRQLYGQEEGTKIFVEHLERVAGICRELNLKPLIWSDMLFCLAAKNNALYAYYDQSNNPAAHEAMTGLPDDVELVFWNYYHVDPEIYARKLQQHRELGCANPWMAGGAWTWNRLWCSLPFTIESNQASLMVSKNQNSGVKHFMLTIWGDEGNECDIFSALPALAFVACHGYTPEPEVNFESVKQSFEAICGGNYTDWVHASKLDEAPVKDPSYEPRMQLPPNMSKWLLWEDPLLSFMSPQYAGYDLEEHYRNLASHLFHGAGQRQQYPHNIRLQLPARLAQVLSLKCHLRERLVNAYRCGNLFQLYELTVHRVDPLIRHTRMLWQYHRALWMYNYKPHGWEVVELRYGGLIARMQTMRDRIMHYIQCQNNRLVNQREGVPPPVTTVGADTGSVRSEQRTAGDSKAPLESTHSLPGDVEMGSTTAVSTPCDMSDVMDLREQPTPSYAASAKLSDDSVVSSAGTTTHGAGTLRDSGHPLAFGLDDPLNLNASGFPTPYVETIPEFEEDLQCIYEHAGTMLLLDYGRVTTPSRLG
ncbi:hypothetical protein IWQ62_002807 [Dispira parvispora]|uniref:beta-N-acetylhexosaminidase n=1 Tax=Dispira parvispora TaxID=1520584 RepID=A0A9W8E6U8_9FUNG|nr:hypothetical protein IWQ62_002807 [Dispira parvispora]